MQQPSPQEIQSKFAALPERLRQAIVGVNSAEAIQLIAKKYKLNIPQMGALGQCGGLVMLGFEHPTNFIKNISASLNVPMEQARLIGQDVNEQVFRAIKDELKKVHGIGEGDGAGNVKSAPPTSIGETTFRGNAAQKTEEKKQFYDSLAGNAPARPELPAVPQNNLPTATGPIKQSFQSEKYTTPAPFHENGETDLSREKVLREIENPTPSRPSSGNIAEDKLSGIVASPHEETKIEEQEAVKPPAPNKNYSNDPYREPLA